ncbi:hypothetical protein FRC12_011784 [Ceratobasidium sp. 428]|nr:hypothetical protein FRC12_011784 [Ceratobasidium sp. 428]
MSEVDQRAEHLIKAYKAADHEDHTRALLLALFTHAPTPEGKAYIRGEVLKNEGDPPGMKGVADSILRKLLLPVIALGTKAHVSPSARTEIKQISLSRDNYRCVVSKAVELSYFYTPETVEWNPGDLWLPTYASHVIPLSATTKSGSWQALERFRKQLPSLPGPPDGAIIRLKSTDPDLPLPSMKYILLHAALAKVLRDSDMGRWVDGTLRELERMESLATDGSHADVLASSLHATGLESSGASAMGTPITAPTDMDLWPLP